MKNICIIIFTLFGVIGVNAQKSDLDLYDYWKHYGDMSNNLYSHLTSIAFEQLNQRHIYISGLDTDEKRQRYVNEVRMKLQKAVGAFPEKTPLNPVITGRLKRDDFVVEKLYFESLPGYYVTAALFIPTKVKGKKPAIVYCCGHSAEGFRSGVYQTCIMNYVKKGFVVLAFDPVGQGERLQYFDEKGESVYSPTHEHSYPGTQSFISGMPPANYFVWDGIRAIDYLVSRKEVDPQRIGITGRSGGGTQAAYIAAMDDRIIAAAPECYITTYNCLLRSEGPQDAEQILMNYLSEGLDMADLIGVRAPKPTLIVSTTRDYFSIHGAREVYKEAQTIYNAFGKSENLSMAEDDNVHASTPKNRKAVYAFFQKYLNNPGNSEEEETEHFDLKDLWVTPNGQIQHFIASETLFSLNKKYTDKIIAKRDNKQIPYAEYSKEVRDKIIKLSGYQKPTYSNDYIFSGRLWRDNYSIERYLVKGVGNYYIPLLRLSPKTDSKETILLLDEKGKKYAVEEGLAGKLAENGYELIIPDLNGIGELNGDFEGGDAIIDDVPLNVWYAGILTHKSPVAVRAEEIKNILDFTDNLKSTSGEIAGLACGTLTSDLLHSAVIEKRFNKLILINPLYMYQSLIEEKNYLTKYAMSAVPGMLAEYDLPDLVSAIAPTKVLMINPLNGIGDKVNANVFNNAYSKVKETYDTIRSSDYFRVETDESNILLSIDKWLEK